jgi:hypothetical protein
MKPKSSEGKGVKEKFVIIPILNDEYKIVVCWGSEEYVCKVLKDNHYPEHEPVDFENNRGKLFAHSRCFPIIALKEEPNNETMIGTLAHEAFHAMDYIFHSIGENSLDEVFAHSIGAIVRITLNNL